MAEQYDIFKEIERFYSCNTKVIGIRGPLWFNPEEMMECVEAMKKWPIRAAIGDTPNALERLGMRFLASGAYIDLDKELEKDQKEVDNQPSSD